MDVDAQGVYISGFSNATGLNSIDVQWGGAILTPIVYPETLRLLALDSRRILAVPAGTLTISFTTALSKLEAAGSSVDSSGTALGGPCAGLPASAGCGNTSAPLHRLAAFACCLRTALRSPARVAGMVAVITSPTNALKVALALRASVLDVQTYVLAAQSSIASSVQTVAVPLYSSTATASASPSAAHSTALEAGAIVGIVVGSSFLACALCCLWCMCTRRIVWRRRPNADGKSEVLEVACVSKDAAASAGAGPMVMVRAVPPPGTPPGRLPSIRGAPSVEEQAAFLTACTRKSAREVLAALQSCPALARSADSASSHGAIHKAVKINNATVLRAFLEADRTLLDLADRNGATPLHHAVVHQALDSIAFLASAGADLTLRDKSGETQLDLARKLFSLGSHKTDAVITALEALCKQ